VGLARFEYIFVLCRVPEDGQSPEVRSVQQLTHSLKLNVVVRNYLWLNLRCVFEQILIQITLHLSPSHWARSLRRGSPAVRLLGLRVRISPGVDVCLLLGRVHTKPTKTKQKQNRNETNRTKTKVKLPSTYIRQNVDIF
jgi:hypothetical protein